MSRRNVRARWYRQVIRTRLVSGSCRELLAYLAVAHMTELGHVKVPRRDLADALDLAEHRVTVRIGEAVKAGLLARIGGGKNGQTMQYAATFPTGQGAAERHPQPEVEVSGFRHPQNDTLGQVSGCRDPAPIRARVPKNNHHNGTPPAAQRDPPEHNDTPQAAPTGAGSPPGSKRPSSDHTAHVA